MELLYRDVVLPNEAQARWIFLLDMLDIDWEMANDKPVWLSRSELAPTFCLPSRGIWLRAATDGDHDAVEAFEQGELLSASEVTRRLIEIGQRSVEMSSGYLDESHHTDILLLAPYGIPDPEALAGSDESGADGSLLMLADGEYDVTYVWTRCPHCGYIDAQSFDRPQRLRCGHEDRWDRSNRAEDPFILACYARARSAVAAIFSAECACGEQIQPGHLIVPTQPSLWSHAHCSHVPMDGATEAR